MSSDDAGIWHPRPEHLNGSCVAELARKLGVSDYDALYKFSIERPADYWRVVNEYCGIVWSRDYDHYSDLSAGKEFPKWFVGGELNWTDTVFSWGKDEAGAARPAIVAEREDGHTCVASRMRSSRSRFARSPPDWKTSAFGAAIASGY